jgi:hypothetical protein
MSNPFNSDTELSFHQLALSIVANERLRQVSEKGYSVEHDDGHPDEELAAAAAFYLQPAMLNPDVCITDGNSLSVLPLIDVIGMGAWAECERFDTSNYLSDEESFYARVKAVTRGLALGLAELERLLRMQAKMAGAEVV